MSGRPLSTLGVSLPTFQYTAEDLAERVSSVVWELGGNADVVMAHSVSDTCPVKYHYRNNNVTGQSVVTEVADNCRTKTSYQYGNRENLRNKFYVLFTDPSFHQLEFSNRRKHVQFERVYKNQVTPR